MSKASFRLALLLVILSAAATLLLIRTLREAEPDPPSVSDRAVRKLAARFAQFEAREQQITETVWASELLAQDCGRTFETLWDSLNAATNKLDVVASFPADQIVVPEWSQPMLLAHGIELRKPEGPGRVLAPGEWRRFVEEFRSAGWQLDQTEFRHIRFETDSADQPRQSRFHFVAHLSHSARPERAVLEGALVVDWSAGRSVDGLASVKRIDASGLTLKTRRGEPPFQPILTETITPPENWHYADPLILHDLDGDGLSEIVLAGCNRVYQRRGDFRYEAGLLCQQPSSPLFTGLIADFDSNETPDFLGAKPEGLVLFTSYAAGGFAGLGKLVWQAEPRLTNAMVMTCGDIDGDGDLDLFLGQYRVPTLGQRFSPHYYDANDGHPSFLLLNDGQGQFADATVKAGLTAKRGRRVFSASFADLDRDGHLDLLVVSDFAGADLYRNDGQGHFTDVTRDWIAEPHAFGMAHVLADFNSDGRLDFLMIGMNSSTVDRLEHLGLMRPGLPGDPAMRSRMTFGNRLYLAQAGPGFRQPPAGDSIARSGWSWGCGAADFDNDGFPDVYIANGHETRQTVRDYDSEFWLHDLYVDESVDDSTATAYFTAKYDRTRGRGWSYGGYEKDRLYLNQKGNSFLEAGHLLGVALEEDSRGVVTDDLDGDGRLDLLLTTLEVWPEKKQTLRLFRNTLTGVGNWIGFRFEKQNRSPAGVTVTLQWNGGRAVRQLVTGDSFRSQHADSLHFGLGNIDHLEKLEVQSPGGRVQTLAAPALNRYHVIRSDSANSGER